MSNGRAKMAYVTFWGTRGSIPTPGRSTEKYGGNTPCVSIECGDTYLVIDAGTGIRNLGLELAAEMVEKGSGMNLHLLLSHTHWDHIQGLPFFDPAYMGGTTLIIYGSQKKGEFLESILHGQMNNDYFPVQMSDFPSNIRIQQLPETMNFDDFTLDTQEQVFNPGGSLRFRINTGDRCIVYASDIELNKIFYPDEPSAEIDAMKDEYMQFIHGADLLIADGQYTTEEYGMHVGWGHTSIPVLVEVAHKCRVKQLALFHHDPQHSDTKLDEILLDISAPFQSADPPMNVFCAREGVSLPI